MSRSSSAAWSKALQKGNEHSPETQERGARTDSHSLRSLTVRVLLLFAGLAIDFGLAYVTKASLGKAVDAAALTAAKYTALGQTQCTQIAQSSFNMNYHNSNRDVASPVFNVRIWYRFPWQHAHDHHGRDVAYFIGLLPAYRTLSVSSTAESRYAKVQMTLVIDRTGSMTTNAPGTTLPDAVTQFIDYFDNVNDSVAMVSFANDQTVDVPFNAGTPGNFQTQIISAIKKIKDNGTLDNGYQGATYSDGALQLASPRRAFLWALPGI